MITHLVDYGFELIFVIGAIILVIPQLDWMASVITVSKRSRFYRHRRYRAVTTDSVESSQSSLMEILKEYLDLADLHITVGYITAISLILGLVTLILSLRMLRSPIDSLIIAILMASIPYLYIFARYQHKRLVMAKSMMETIQNFISYYTENDNLQTSIYRASSTMPAEMRREWKRLVLDLELGRDAEASLLSFAARVSNEWAQDFADILCIHLETGQDITTALYKLVNEMDIATKNEDKKTILLLSYRWGTLFMCVVSIFVVYYNIHLSRKNAYYYFQDPLGKKIITISVIIMFLSFLYSLYLGRRKI